MLFLDIGANRGAAVLAGLQLGYKVVAIEAAPRVYAELVKNFIYNQNVIPLKFAISSQDEAQVEFYECVEDGLSTLNKDWLTAQDMPYAGKHFRTIKATTRTIERLVETYGEPDLIKIDVEGAEWQVFKGMNKRHGILTFEWTDATLNEHAEQLRYLKQIGYNEVGPQYIVQHLQQPDEWYDISKFSIKDWISSTSKAWTEGGWQTANLRPTADVGMLWVR